MSRFATLAEIRAALEADRARTKRFILKRNGGNALFLFIREGSDGTFEAQYCVAAPDEADKDKKIGDTVDSWSRSEYFGHDIDGAIEYLKGVKR
jgi:hypothetical protein